jgi:hypothetical protein
MGQVWFERYPEMRPARGADIPDQAASGSDLSGSETGELAEVEPVLWIGASAAESLAVQGTINRLCKGRASAPYLFGHAERAPAPGAQRLRPANNHLSLRMASPQLLLQQPSYPPCGDC